MQFTQIINIPYQWQKALYKEVVSSFITEFIIGKDHLNPQFRSSVNA